MLTWLLIASEATPAFALQHWMLIGVIVFAVIFVLVAVLGLVAMLVSRSDRDK